MKKELKDKNLLITIFEHCNKINQTIETATRLNILDDDIFFDAINLNISQIGENANKISDDLKIKYTDIKWREIIGMRNFIVHNYGALNKYKIVNTITNDIPILKRQIKNILQKEYQYNLTLEQKVIKNNKFKLNLSKPSGKGLER